MFRISKKKKNRKNLNHVFLAQCRKLLHEKKKRYTVLRLTIPHRVLKILFPALNSEVIIYDTFAST